MLASCREVSRPSAKVLKQVNAEAWMMDGAFHEAAIDIMYFNWGKGEERLAISQSSGKSADRGQWHE